MRFDCVSLKYIRLYPRNQFPQLSSHAEISQPALLYGFDLDSCRSRGFDEKIRARSADKRADNRLHSFRSRLPGEFDQILCGARDRVRLDNRQQNHSLPCEKAKTGLAADK